MRYLTNIFDFFVPLVGALAFGRDSFFAGALGFGGGGGGGGSTSQSTETTNQDNRVVGQGDSVGIAGSSNVTITQTKTDYGAVKSALQLSKDVTSGALAAVDHTANAAMAVINEGSLKSLNVLSEAYSEAKGNDKGSQRTIIIIAGLAVVGVAAVSIALRE